MTAHLQTSEVSRRFGKVQALSEVTLTVPEGAIAGLIGPNGAGKTTLLRILAGLEAPDEGAVEIRRADGGRSRIGFVPDFQGIYERLTVREYLEFFASAYDLPRERRAPRVEACLSMTGLSPLSEKSADSLSKGVTQRLSLARALLPDPDALLLDEPASGLDPRARVGFFDLLRELAAEGKTLVISSHILKELTGLVDTVIILEAGRLAAAGALDEVLASLDGGVAQGILALKVEVLSDARRAARRLAALDFIESAEAHGDQLVRVLMKGEADRLPELLKHLLDDGLPVTGLAREGADLERAFLSLTRDEVV